MADDDKDCGKKQGSITLKTEEILKLSKDLAIVYLYNKCFLEPKQQKREIDLTELYNVADIILDYEKPLNIKDNMEWLKWLISSGRPPNDFYAEVLAYDDSILCSNVWSKNQIAYRCRTCGLTPCISLCYECFKCGNHVKENHEYFMFISTTGGACDCGNTDLVKESGSCPTHQPLRNPIGNIPPEVVITCEALMPRILLSYFEEKETFFDGAFYFLMLFLELSSLGSVMRNLLARFLCNKELYKAMTTPQENKYNYLQLLESQNYYTRVVEYSQGVIVSGRFAELNSPVSHETFLDELVFWMIKFDFSKPLPNILLKIRLDSQFEKAFARTFIQHYSRALLGVIKSRSPEEIGSRFVSVSIQILSVPYLAYQLTNNHNLLYIMVALLEAVVSSAIIPLYNRADSLLTSYKVANCVNKIISSNCCWPVASDLNNVLSYKPIAIQFMSTSRIFDEWLIYVSYFQGMNAFNRKCNPPEEIDTHYYNSAYVAELQGLAYPLCSMTRHLTPEFLSITIVILKKLLRKITVWFKGYIKYTRCVHNWVTFHLPLHRHYIFYISKAITLQGATLEEILPPIEILQFLMVNPLQLLVTFFEVFAKVWFYNGVEMIGQATSYIKTNCTFVMLDNDIYLLQICAGTLPPEAYLISFLERFQVMNSLFLLPKEEKRSDYDERNCPEYYMVMLESCLILLAIVLNVRTKLGLDKERLTKLELATLLCVKNEKFSTLLETVSENPDLISDPNKLESLLEEIAVFREPYINPYNEPQEGSYVAKDKTWLTMFDPIYALYRTLQRKYFKGLVEHFEEKCKNFGIDENCWPPYRLPAPVDQRYEDPLILTHSSTFHGLLFMLLFKALSKESKMSHEIISLVIFFLELTVEYQLRIKTEESDYEVVLEKQAKQVYIDGQFDQWFVANDIFINATITIERVFINDHEMDCVVEHIEGFVDLEEKLRLLGLPSLVPSNFEPSRDSSEVDSRKLPDTGSFSHESTGSLLGPNYMLQAKTVHKYDSSVKETEGILHKMSELLPLLKIHKRREEAHEVSLFLAHHDKDLPGTSSGSGQILNVGESMISLLIKLLVKYSENIYSYKPNFCCKAEDARVGNGAFFIEKVLNKLGAGNYTTGLKVTELFEEMLAYLQKTQELAVIARERKRRKDIAKNRREQIMALFSKKQKDYLKTVKLNESGATKKTEKDLKLDDTKIEGVEKELDCVICSCQCFPISESPFGLLVLLQGTNVVGYKTFNAEILEIPLNSKMYTLSGYMNTKKSAYQDIFTSNSWLVSMNIGWSGGMYLHTCGHYMHVECYKTYFKTVHKFTPVKLESTEILCPLCQQLINGLLPVLAEEVMEVPSVEKVYRNIHFEIDALLSSLFNVIGFYAKQTGVVQFNEIHWIRNTWSFITCQPPSDGVLVHPVCVVPLLMRDLVAVFLELIAHLPANFHQIIVQAVIYTIKKIKKHERKRILLDGPLEPLFRLVLEILEDNSLFSEELTNCFSSDAAEWTVNDAMQEVRHICVDFLRIVALLNSHLYSQDLPVISDPSAECESLEKFLELWTLCSVTNVNTIELMCSSMGITGFPACLSIWCSEIPNFESPASVAASVIMSHIKFPQPRLLSLPKAYSEIFQYYQNERCSICGNVCKEPCLCLTCGGLFCLRRYIAIGAQADVVSDVVQHAGICGSGTAVFLEIESTLIVIIRGSRICHWGSVYLDSRGEKDVDLKRGRPLYLRKDFYQLLEKNWLMHLLDQATKNWNFHRDFT